MTHFLDQRPLDFSNRAVRELLQTLIDTYDSARQVRSVVQLAGISPAFIDLEQPVAQAWIEVLRVAQNQEKLRPLLNAVIDSPDAAAANRIRELIAQEPLTAVPEPAGQVDWKIDPADVEGLERQIESQSTLLDISFLERGLELAPSVARLLVTLSDGTYHGTAFRISERLLLTNHHVLFGAAGPATSVERGSATNGRSAVPSACTPLSRADRRRSRDARTTTGRWWRSSRRCPTQHR